MKLATDSLGFALTVSFYFVPLRVRGRLVAMVDADTQAVTIDTPHAIEISDELVDSELVEVVSHEVYHLFFSIRHLIKVDEETESLVFGQLVKHIHQASKNQLTKTDKLDKV